MTEEKKVVLSKEVDSYLDYEDESYREEEQLYYETLRQGYQKWLDDELED